MINWENAPDDASYIIDKNRYVKWERGVEYEMYFGDQIWNIADTQYSLEDYKKESGFWDLSPRATKPKWNGYVDADDDTQGERDKLIKIAYAAVPITSEGSPIEAIVDAILAKHKLTERD